MKWKMKTNSSRIIRDPDGLLNPETIPIQSMPTQLLWKDQ